MQFQVTLYTMTMLIVRSSNSNPMLPQSSQASTICVVSGFLLVNVCALYMSQLQPLLQVKQPGMSWVGTGWKNQGASQHWTSWCLAMSKHRQPIFGNNYQTHGIYTNTTVAAFGKLIFSIGGKSALGAVNKVFVYFPGMRIWLHVAKLPCSFYGCMPVIIPSNKLLLIGGCSSIDWCKHLKKGVLKQGP